MARMGGDLAHLLTEKGVDPELQEKFGDIMITTVRLFSLVAENRVELKTFLKDPPFSLDPEAHADPADKVKARVSIAQITDAWLTATARVTEKTRVEAEQRAVGVPLALPQGDHVVLKLAYEKVYRRTRKEDWPSGALVERRLTEVEQGDLKAESLQDVSSEDEQSDDPQDAVCYLGVYKIKRVLTRVKLPSDSEGPRHRLGILGITYSLARLKYPTRKWLETATPALFTDHADHILGKDVYQLTVKVNGAELRPPWTLVLSYEYEIRKAVVEAITYEALDIGAAFQKVYRDTEHRQKHFLTPCMAAAVMPPEGFGKAQPASSADRPSPYPPPPLLSHAQLGKGGGKNKGKNKGKDKGKDHGKTTAGGLRNTPDDGTEICFRFNLGAKRCNGKCSRAHVCRKCLGPHGAYECKKGA